MSRPGRHVSDHGKWAVKIGYAVTHMAPDIDDNFYAKHQRM